MSENSIYRQISDGMADFKEMCKNLDALNEHAMANLTPAARTYSCIMNAIDDFESELDETMEAGIQLLATSNSITLNVEKIGYHGENILVFQGITGEGNRVRLLQSINQLNMLLVSVQRKDDVRHPRRKIGFVC